jgi:hypothetical protein
MYTLEYLASKGRASENEFHKNIVDYYLLYKDDKRVFSERQDWDCYCLMFEIDNLNKEISIKKTFVFTVSNSEIKSFGIVSSYNCRDDDYYTIKEELITYIEEVKIMLDILEYKTRL